MISIDTMTLERALEQPEHFKYKFVAYVQCHGVNVQPSGMYTCLAKRCDISDKRVTCRLLPFPHTL